MKSIDTIKISSVKLRQLSLIETNTEGASIAYKLNPDAKTWYVYSEPFKYEEGSQLISIAHRIGYLPSKEVKKSGAY